MITDENFSAAHTGHVLQVHCIGAMDLGKKTAGSLIQQLP